MLKTSKYTNADIVHHFALYHAIGQLEDVNLRGATIAEVARFMNVSKPTAMKHVERLAKGGNLSLVNDREWGSMGRITIELSAMRRTSYEKKSFLGDYRRYVASVLKVSA